jgi:non-heme chloroperoxidase
MPLARTDDEIDLWYDVSGEGDRTVLLLHGWGGAGSGHSWRQLLPHLDLARLRVVAMDFRGHGRSGAARGCFTVERFAMDALAVAAAAGLERMVLAGFSMGAKVAQWIACRRPELVEAQFLMAPLALGPMPLTETLLRMWLRMAHEEERFGQMLAGLESPPIAPDVMRAFFQDCYATGDFVLAETFRMCARDAGGSCLGATIAPTLIVGGERDGLMRPDLLRERVSDRIPGSKTVTIDAGHQMPLTRGRELGQLLMNWLSIRY